jgi:hypothetical protein
MVEMIFPTPDCSYTFADIGVLSKEELDTLRQLMSRLETFVGIFNKEEVYTSSAYVLTEKICYYIFLCPYM